MSDDVLDPEDRVLARREQLVAAEENQPIYAPASWHVAAGRIVPVGATEAPLEPFSFARQAAAQRLQMGESVFESAALLVFLCLSTRDEIDRARGSEAESRFRERMEIWADKIGACLRSATGEQVMRVGDQIWDRMAASESSPVIEGGTPIVHDPNV
jgi:hypothetical protein